MERRKAVTSLPNSIIRLLVSPLVVINFAMWWVRTEPGYDQGVYGYGMGYQSYEFFHEPLTQAPRCNLFGANVENTLQSVNDSISDVLYDIGCGNPSP